MEATAERRKRKVHSELSTLSIQLKTRRLGDFEAGITGSFSCDDDLVSCCSSNGSIELGNEPWKFLDLEDNNEEFLTTSADDSSDSGGVRRATTPLRDAEGESGEHESTAERNPRPSSPVKMPSEAELEDFFAAAEKSLQQKFVDKYNYDIVKDQPLEGRYEWARVQLKPE